MTSPYDPAAGKAAAERHAAAEAERARKRAAVAGPMGLGKTMLALLLMHAQLGLGDGRVLGLPVPERPGKILYLAMDRPAQIARAVHRLFTENERQVLAERLLIWRGRHPATSRKTRCCSRCWPMPPAPTPCTSTQ